MAAWAGAGAAARRCGRSRPHPSTPGAIKGWFKVQPHSADPQALFSSRRWYLQPPEKAVKPAFSRHGAAARARGEGARRRRGGQRPRRRRPQRRRGAARRPHLRAALQLSHAGRRRVLLGRPDRPGRSSTAKAWRSAPCATCCPPGRRPCWCVDYEAEGQAGRAHDSLRRPPTSTRWTWPAGASPSTGSPTTEARRDALRRRHAVPRAVRAASSSSGVTRRAFESRQVDVRLWNPARLRRRQLPPRRRPPLRRRPRHGDAGRAAGALRWPPCAPSAPMPRRVVLFSPTGRRLDQALVAQLVGRRRAPCCCAAATRASTSASSTPMSTCRSAWATSCSRAARSPPWRCWMRWRGCSRAC